MKLSVIIVNYNVKYFLEQCLISAQKALSGLDGEIWVVDNDSVDGSVEMVLEKFPTVNCIANKTNTGFSVANNQALRKAKGEYVLLLNPDTVVQEDTFAKCIKHLDNDLNIGGLGVKMIDGKGKYLPESKRGLPTPEVAMYKMIGLNKLFPKSHRFGKYHLGFIDENQTAEIDVLAGAFMMMRSSVLEKVGLLDETFFMYGEDIDLSYRITKAGYKNVYFPETSIIHYKGESTKRMSVNYVFIFYRAMVIFAKKHYTGSTAKLFTNLINVSIYIRAFLAIIQRFVLKTWLFAADAALTMASLHIIKDYWEEHIKNFEGYFSPIYSNTHFPAYTSIWMLLVFWSGGYQKPYSAVKVMRGVLVGTVLISALFAFLPNNLQYSRGIILAGTAATSLVMIAVRLLSHYKTYGNLRLGEALNVKTVIVGEKQERERVLGLIQKSNNADKFLGFIALSDDETEETLGNVNRLDEICELYKVDEVIFCSKDLTSAYTMDWMVKMSSTSISFKIVPDDSGFIIGSNAKDINGELYTEEVKLALLDKNTLQKKRLIDVAISLLLLPLGLIVGWFGKGFFKFYRNLFQALLGSKTWVSYDYSVNVEGLPKLKKGIYPVSVESTNKGISESVKNRLNYFYAKNYVISTDLEIVFKQLFK